MQQKQQQQQHKFTMKTFKNRLLNHCMWHETTCDIARIYERHTSNGSQVWRLHCRQDIIVQSYTFAVMILALARYDLCAVGIGAGGWWYWQWLVGDRGRDVHCHGIASSLPHTGSKIAPAASMAAARVLKTDSATENVWIFCVTWCNMCETR